MALENALIYGGFAAAAIGVVHNAINTHKPIDPSYDFDNQSVEIDPVERIRVSKSARGKPLLEYRYDDVRTLYDVLPKGLALSNDGPCLGKRDGPGKGQYRWLKYSEVLDRVSWVGSGLINKGIPSSNQTNMGIYSSNRSEWIIAEHACYTFSFPVVSLYDSYGKESIKYVIKHADLRAIFIDNFYRLCNVLENLDEYDDLKLIIYFDPMNDLRKQKVKSILETKRNREKCEIFSLDELMEIGRKNIQKPCPPKPTDLATVCYTSGTTGVPKGAMISHLNFISNEAASYSRLSKPQFNYILTSSDVHYCYLPLAHLFARISLIMCFLAGTSCGFISGDISVFLDDLQELKPTNMPMVPRILNKFYNEVYKKVNSKPIQKMILNHAISSKNSSIQKGKYDKNTFYDRRVFNEIRSKFGGRMDKTISGSAPISGDVMKFSRAVLNCPIPEAYGQTEATCGISICHPFDPEIGHVGPPLDCWMVKLIDVPDMDYFSQKNQGEICVKGPSRFMGYLNDPEKTAEAIDKDGWLHTGDVGEWRPNGTLKIIDRKKNLFKLSQGEYISPEKLENVYAKCEYASQIFVDGDPLKDSVVAIVVPDAEVLTKTFRINFQDPIYHQSAEELCKLQKVKTYVLNDLVRVGKTAGLMSYELLKNIHLHPEPFTVENDLLTPTMKLKRNVLHARFKSTVDFLYKEAETTELGFARL